MDSFSNFAVTTVRHAPAPMAGGLTLTVDDPSVFPDVPFSVTVWPATDPQATAGNSEVLRVSAVDGKTLTFSRAQEGSSPIKIWRGYKIGQLPTKVFYESLAAGAVTEAVAEAVPTAVQQSTVITQNIVTEEIDAVFDTVPAEPLGVAAPGTSDHVARQDHVHLMPKLDGVTAPDDTTTLDATQSLHGLMSKVDKRKLDLGKRTLKSVTNTYTVDTVTQDQVIFCARATPFTVTLVDATAGTGLTHYERELTIANLGVGDVTIASAAGSQIFTHSAEASIVLLTGDSVNLFCNGAVWKAI